MSIHSRRRRAKSSSFPRGTCPESSCCPVGRLKFLLATGRAAPGTPRTRSAGLRTGEASRGGVESGQGLSPPGTFPPPRTLPALPTPAACRRSLPLRPSAPLGVSRPSGTEGPPRRVLKTQAGAVPSWDHAGVVQRTPATSDDYDGSHRPVRTGSGGRRDSGGLHTSTLLLARPFLPRPLPFTSLLLLHSQDYFGTEGQGPVRRPVDRGLRPGG